MATCFFNSALAMDELPGTEIGSRKRSFTCPTIDEFRDYARKFREQSPSVADILNTFSLEKEGITFTTVIYPWNTNYNIIQRILNIKEYERTCLVEKGGFLQKIFFQYSQGSAEPVILEVDFKAAKVDCQKVSYDKELLNKLTSDSLDGTQYTTLENPNLRFTIAG